jgi:hypothetical protein
MLHPSLLKEISPLDFEPGGGGWWCKGGYIRITAEGETLDT